MTKEQLEALIAQLNNSKAAAQDWGTVLGVNAQDVAHAFADTLSNAFEKFATDVAQGKNVFKSLGNAFLQFAADFLRMIGEMILKAVAFKIAMAALNAMGVPVGTAHTGGVIGSGAGGGGSRSVSPAVFAGAARMHSGGIAGLRPDEVPTILQRGEEVLTADNPRHVKNQRGGRGGMARGGGNSNPNLKNVVVFNDEQIVQALANSSHFDKVFLTVVSRKQREMNSILKGSG
jgi:hypothetical protein